MIEESTPEVAERYGNPYVLERRADRSRRSSSRSSSAGARRGVISLQNVDRTHAFSEADQRLLTTLAGSLSVALENARLVHETRQRVAELATVNSVGQALASQLELDALIELVGERVRETFEADIAYVALHDEAAGTDRLRLLLRERASDGPSRRSSTARGSRPRSSSRASRSCSTARSSTRARTGRHAFALVPRRADPRRREGDRRDQRPEHRGGGTFRRGRRPPAGHDRSQRRRRDPERAPVRRGRTAARALRVAGRDQPGRGRRHGRRGARDRLEPGGGGALRLLGGRGGRPPDRRPRLRRRRSATRGARSRARPWRAARAPDHERAAQGRDAGRRRADARPAHASTASTSASSGSTTTSRSCSAPARRPRRRPRRRAPSSPR